MKTFSMKHRIHSETPAQEFTEEDPPEWLVSKAYKWFFDDHLLKLKVGQVLDTDFRSITRIK